MKQSVKQKGRIQTVYTERHLKEKRKRMQEKMIRMGQEGNGGRRMCVEKMGEKMKRLK